MAKAAAINTEESAPNRALSVVNRGGDFLRDVRSEMHKVVTPSRAEVQSTTLVVIISVFAFAAFFWGVDEVLGTALKHIYHWLGAVQ